MIIDEPMSKRILLLRSMHSITAGIIAKKLKMTPRQYLLLEEGRAEPDYFTVRRLMEIYGCTSDYLLFGIMLGLRKDLFARLNDGGRADLSASELYHLHQMDIVETRRSP